MPIYKKGIAYMAEMLLNNYIIFICFCFL